MKNDFVTGILVAAVLALTSGYVVILTMNVYTNSYESPPSGLITFALTLMATEMPWPRAIKSFLAFLAITALVAAIGGFIIHAHPVPIKVQAPHDDLGIIV